MDGCSASFSHRPQQRHAIAANDLLCTIDHHLRRVHALQVESLAIGILPCPYRPKRNKDRTIPASSNRSHAR